MQSRDIFDSIFEQKFKKMLEYLEKEELKPFYKMSSHFPKCLVILQNV